MLLKFRELENTKIYKHKQATASASITYNQYIHLQLHRPNDFARLHQLQTHVVKKTLLVQ